MTGAELKSALDGIGLRQSDLARLLTAHSVDVTVSSTTIHRWCSGEHPVPGSVALAVRLLVDHRRLFGDGKHLFDDVMRLAGKR